MTFVLALAALVLGTAGAIRLYLASPQQQWRVAGPWPGRRRWWPGTALALASLLATMQVVAPMEAVFAWSVLLMLVLSVAPFLGAWRARTRAARPS